VDVQDDQHGTHNMDPLSMSASIAGLIALAQGLIPPLVKFVDDVRSYPVEFSELMTEIRGLCGVLVLLQPVIEKLEVSSDFEISTGQSLSQTHRF